MPNEVITMYKDKTYTEALYPRTVAGAVAWDNNQTIAQYIANNVGFYGIDTSRVIASGVEVASYTANQDCYVCAIRSVNGAYKDIMFLLNGATIGHSYTGTTIGIASVIVPVKANQTIICRFSGGEEAANFTFTAYGVKH